MSHCHHHHDHHRRCHHERRHFGLVARVFGHRFCHHNQCHSCNGNVTVIHTTVPVQTPVGLNPKAALFVSASAPVDRSNVQSPYPTSGYPTYPTSNNTAANRMY